ncbi:MAG: hemerythrin domain-containing protein [Deltaproteobacteria bacterium]|nr:hemerythrin domain-containing protein [Deltaproteobacteria bacterium]
MRHVVTRIALVVGLGACASAPVAGSSPRVTPRAGHGDHHHGTLDAHDERASAAFRAEHAHILRRIEETDRIARSLVERPAEADARLRAALGFFTRELGPHADAEEHVLYAVADRTVASASPHRWTDSLRYEHTVVHREVRALAAVVDGSDRSEPTVIAAGFRVIALLGLVRAHFGAEERVVLEALDRTMTRAQFEREIIAPTEAYVRGRGHTE